MGKKSSPPPPDYTRAAEIQAQSSRENTQTQTEANRPNIYTPWGSQTWAQNGNQWAQTTTLSPQQQAALDDQMAIQAGRSQGALQLLSQATGAFQSPVDYSQLPQGATAVSAPNLGGGGTSPQWGGAASSINPGGEISGWFNSGPGVQYGGGYAGRINQQGPQSGDIRYGLDMGNVGGASVGAASAQEIALKDQMDRTAGDWRQRGQDAALAFMQPNLDRRQQQLETQLTNMGLTRGSEAWNAELQREQDQRTRDEYQAFGQGRQEAEMLFGQDLAASNFTNQARMNQFQQGAFNAGLQNQANMVGAQLQQQANFQNAQNRLLEANFWNQAQAQQYGQDLSTANFQNQAQAQRFGQNQARMSAYNQAQAQQFGQNQVQAQFGNQAQQQQFAQNAANVGVYNQAQQANFDNLMRQAQYGDQQAIQQMQLQMQAGGFNQQIRQQQLAEQIAGRAQPLNELNALLTGQQVGMPQMPQFNTAGRSDTTNYLGAAQSQYQAQMDQFNAGQAGSQGLMSGLFSLGGAAMQSGGWGGLFSMGGSLREYKDNIRRVGTHDKLGVGIYAWEYKPEFAEKWGYGTCVGVMVDELARVLPGAIHLDADGHTVVDYTEVW